jgi:hypothetical protein
MVLVTRAVTPWVAFAYSLVEGPTHQRCCKSVIRIKESLIEAKDECDHIEAVQVAKCGAGEASF